MRTYGTKLMALAVLVTLCWGSTANGQASKDWWIRNSTGSSLKVYWGYYNSDKVRYHGEMPAGDEDGADTQASAGDHLWVIGYFADGRMTVADIVIAASGRSIAELKVKSGKPLLMEDAVEETALQAGCWVKVYEDDNFQDDWDQINGPAQYPNMRNLPGADKDDWGDEIDSLIVGPHARVVVYEDENYGDTKKEFGPNSQIRVLDSYGIGDNIDSIKIYYEP